MKLTKASQNELLLVVLPIAIITVWYWILLLGHPNFHLSADFKGWWGWFDQGQYLKFATGITSGTSPTTWLFQPIYPGIAGVIGKVSMLVAPMPPAPIAAAQIGFYLLDCILLVSAAYSFHLLALRFDVSFGAWIFLCTNFLTYQLAEAYVIPWTSTFTIPFLYLILYFSLADEVQPRHAIIVTGCCILLLFSRPSDLVVALAPVAVLWGRFLKHRVILWPLFIGATGALMSILLLLSWGKISGVGPFGPYFAMATQNGHSFQNFPYKTLVLLNDATFFGAYAASFRSQNIFLYGALVGGSISCFSTRDWRLKVIGFSMLLFLLAAFSFNDMHPLNVFRYLLIHYYKFLFPLCILAIGILCRDFPLRVTVVACAVLMLASLRVHREISPGNCELSYLENQMTAFDCKGLVHVKGLELDVDNGEYHKIFFGPHLVGVDNVSLQHIKDYRIYPRPGMQHYYLEFQRPITGKRITFQMPAPLKVTKIESFVRTIPW